METDKFYNFAKIFTPITEIENWDPFFSIVVSVLSKGHLNYIQFAITIV